MTKSKKASCLQRLIKLRKLWQYTKKKVKVNSIKRNVTLGIENRDKTTQPTDIKKILRGYKENLMPINMKIQMK